ncbi:Z1 domain-containing protein [Rhodoplanes sp. Z2-YC6860]|uniref:Z1 domain-containing protein n=1 Tax=Rhodoplanes sp. Z2-YC6860 TaxID=674703 RepID=UPI00078E3C31|nr:Z1 domain-containing protein [Rhodoplanes sp. Z2-YC6860]AMN44718.1 endonuclease [Rhodoplanes sp. Z2-YC6860]
MSTDISAENLARMAAQGLRLDPAPTEAEIDHVLERLGVAFAADQTILLEARKLLHARFSIRMEMGQTIKEEHVPWLDARRADIEPFYWERYRELLLRNGWPPLVAGTLDRSMDELLDLLGDPQTTGRWKRRGLVVGDVQSGKTASYAALICKAADAGYKMVVLLAGTLENVRRQTQERLDEAFVGLDSRAFLARDQLKHKTHIGVGHIDSRRDGIVFTSRDKDFRAGIASALSISLNSVIEPVLVVAKKNKGVLTNLSTWLRTMNADRHGNIDLPLLLIDDEADNASINTRKDPTETTAINKGIRDLLALFTRSSYVGFTATPFANIFIDPSSTNEMLGDDLFPRDFIHLLEPPTNYVGMNALFPSADPEARDADDEDEEAWKAGIRTIDDADEWLPVDHKIDHVPGPPPDTLQVALRQFLISTAIRDLRSAEGKEGHERGIHRSMLVNVSRFTSIQNQVAAQLHVELENIRQQTRLYGRMSPVAAARNSPAILSLEKAFNEEFSDSGLSWKSVLGALHDSISPIRVQPVNQMSGSASLDYGTVKEAPGVRVIAVGGNSLSRGLTLEGLCVSYFLRNSKAYDTLMQMGRWFGYRDGYRDLCRLWMAADAEGWYRHVTEATNELKRDFARMRRQRATPAEFGLRVRTHPDTLLITARNKMATGVNIVGEVRDISLAGRGIETARLYADENRNRENFKVIDRFVTDLTSTIGDPNESPNGSAALWRNVPADTVGKLLQDFLVHPLNHDFQGDAIAEFLADATKRNDPQLSRWIVALPTNGDMGPVTPALSSGLAVNAKRRIVLLRQSPPQSLLVSGKKARVGGREDVLHALAAEDVRMVREAEHKARPDAKNIPEDAFRAAMSVPLLVLYLLRGIERERKGAPETDYKSGLVLPALGLHFPGIRDPNAPKRYVSYRLNRIAQAELEVDGDDATDDDDSDD